MPRGVLGITLLLSVLTGGASAATVRIEDEWSVFRAARGESNRLEVYPDEESDEGAFFTDTNASIEAEPPCSAYSVPDADYAYCPYADGPYAQGFRIYLGDKADFLDNRMFETWTDGGRGNDVLNGSEFSDYIYGGGGKDRLYGGGAEDELGDRDAASEASSDADFFFGGPGTDWVTYGDRQPDQPVRVDLASGRAGPDRLRSIKSVRGGAGNDTLLGNRRWNVLVGNGGIDSLFGRGGGDSLEAAPGSQFSGGKGADEIDVRPMRRGPPAAIDCGRGLDLVHSLPEDRLARNCERAYVGPKYRDGRPALALRTRGRLEDGYLVFDVLCSVCEGAVDFSDSEGRHLGRSVLSQDDPHQLRLRLTRPTRRRVRQGLVIQISSSDGGAGFTMLQRG